MECTGDQTTSTQYNGDHPHEGKVDPDSIAGMVMILHGPEIFDSGNAAWLFRQLSPRKILVAGVMARAAAEESGLPCEYPGVPPSMVIQSLGEPCYLANQGKTPESGRIFGEIIAGKIGAAGLLHVECARREIICWNRKADEIAGEISRRTGYMVREMKASPVESPGGFRTIRGCIPGEVVYVNGTVIGRATEHDVQIRYDGKKILPVSGISVKEHGLEKLERAGSLDITRAWCKSGTIRSRPPAPTTRAAASGRVLFIDHCGHHLYRMISGGRVCGIVSVGDDTTAVCGHIGAHMGIPVFGIVDGDCDEIVPPRYAPGSLLAVAEGITDDELGREVSRIVPDGEVSWDECVARIIAFIGKRARVYRPHEK